MSDALSELLKSAADTIEVIPEIYEDGLQPTVQEVGKLVARVPRAINAALSQFDLWILNREYNIEETKKLLAKKLENISIEKIVPPEPYVAVPALQAISYSMDNNELRNLYANLLSKAMNIDTKDLVHPCFTDIIKQMSPLDARVLQSIMVNSVTPIIHISVGTNESKGYANLIDNISWMTFDSFAKISISINNLSRLGLIDLPSGDHYTDDSIYNTIKEQTQFRELTSKYEKQINPDNQFLKFTKGYIKKTDLGIQFNQICNLGF